MKNILYSIIFFAILFPGYDAGDAISEEHLNMVFDTCFGEESTITFSNYYKQSIIWLNISASW